MIYRHHVVSFATHRFLSSFEKVEHALEATLRHNPVLHYILYLGTLNDVTLTFLRFVFVSSSFLACASCSFNN